MNRQSLVSFGATLLAFAFGAMLAWLIARTFRRHHQYPTQTYWRALPVGLAIALVCVLISRLSHFEPGYLYGVVVSVAFVGSLKDRHNAHLITISTISTLSVAVLAWLAWIPFNHLALEHGSNFMYGVIDDALASIFIGGIVGTVVGLIPLRGLPGENLSKWRKDVWALVFFVALFLLIEVELHPASGPTHTGAASLVTVIVLFVFFGGSTLAMRAFFAKRHTKKVDVSVAPSDGVTSDRDERHSEGVDYDK
jgi:MFS family permease